MLIRFVKHTPVDDLCAGSDIPPIVQLCDQFVAFEGTEGCGVWIFFGMSSVVALGQVLDAGSRLHLFDRFAEASEHGVYRGLRQDDQLFGQHFGDSSDPRRHNLKATRGSLYNGHAVGFGQGSIYEDLAASQNVSDFRVLESTQQSNAVLDIALLSDLLQENPFWTIASDQEVNVVVFC